MRKIETELSFEGEHVFDPHRMIILKPNPWEMSAGAALIVGAAAFAVWWSRRKRPTPDEIEHARREILSRTGRLVDGMLLDICEMQATDGRTLTMLVYNYRIGGVDYECSQDITALRETVDPAEVRAGFPCSVRYQQRNPQNSIVISEEWTGLRANLPQLPRRRNPAPGAAPQGKPLPQ